MKNSKKNIIVSLFLLLSILFTGCLSLESNEAKEKSRMSKINSFYREWEGTRYQLGGTTRKGVDCSALMQHLYKEKFGVNLPRTTKLMVKKGKRIRRRSKWQVGDLVFFNTGKRDRHVGVYVGNNKFMHASSSRGVMISTINSYWRKRFWQTRRVL